ncbi:abelson tyrosine-protein kinase 1 [Pelomyxa schiedti]|nr:abelson tyrosine-protein kinase 1 [Pelomyxa schiedti]
MACGFSLGEWLCALGVGHHDDVFRKAELTSVDALLLVDEDDISSLGLPLGARKIVWAGISKLRLSQSHPSLGSSTSGGATTNFDLHASAAVPRVGTLDPTELVLKHIVGKGSFGAVFAATWRGAHVAVKISNSREGRDEFLREAGLLQDMRHPNIVTFYGTYNDLDGNLCIVTEFAPKGSLNNFLIQTPKNTFTTEQLCSMAKDAAQGMSHLHSRNIIHRDLAARNLLVFPVGEDFQIKVSDFGLSRLIEDREVYMSTGSFPIKWTAPEGIEFHKFTSASDSWSFAVVLWEIFTNGAVPYPSVENREVLSLIKKGDRMPKPEGCPDAVYTLMKTCWDIEPSKRPTFENIVSTLEAIIQHGPDASSSHVIPSSNSSESVYSSNDTYQTPAPNSDLLSKTSTATTATATATATASSSTKVGGTSACSIAVCNATPNVHDISSLVARAFFNDPSSVYKFPEPSSRLNKMIWLNTNVAAVALNNWVVFSQYDDETSKLIGVSVWRPPNMVLPQSSLWSAPFSVGPQSMKRMKVWRTYTAKQREQVTGKLPTTTPCWSLYWVCVDPGHQRHGLGSWLVQAGVTYIKQHLKKGTCAVVYGSTSTSDAVTFLCKKGFRVVNTSSGSSGSSSDAKGLPVLYSLLLDVVALP